MKRIAFLFLMLASVLTGCSDLDNDKIYFFTKTNCPYCQKAEQYISEAYPTLKVEYMNVTKQDSMETSWVQVFPHIVCFSFSLNYPDTSI